MTIFDIYIDNKHKDELVDELLHNNYNDFFFVEVKRYGSKILLRSDKEQVTGRQDNTLLRLYIQDEYRQESISLIKSTTPDAQIFMIACEEVL